MLSLLLLASFWLGLAFLGFTVVGYAALTRRRAERLGARVNREPLAEWPTVAVVLCGHNEADRLPERLRNLAATDYPAERLRLVVVDDGSNDGTEQAVHEAAAELAVPVTLLRQPERRGKPAGLNLARGQVTETVVVLTDVRQRFDAATIPHLVQALADPAVGAVSGHLEIAASAAGVGGGVGRYWLIERQLRADEARLDSCIGCTGAVYALRRSLWPEIPEDTLIDDVEIPLRIAATGARIDFEPAARAFDPQALDPAREAVRKQRTLAGNFQLLARHPRWILPGGHRLWWGLFWHKIARLLVPPALAVVLVASLALAPGQPFYATAATGQVLLYALGLLGLANPAWQARVYTVPASFLFLQWQVIRGFWLWLTPRGTGAWARVR